MFDDGTPSVFSGNQARSPPSALPRSKNHFDSVICFNRQEHVKVYHPEQGDKQADDALLEALKSQIEDLKARLDKSEDARTAAEARFAALLTDERKKRSWWPWVK